MTRYLFGGVILAVLVIAYTVVISGKPLLGLILAAGILLATWVLST